VQYETTIISKSCTFGVKEPRKLELYYDSVLLKFLRKQAFRRTQFAAFRIKTSAWVAWSLDELCRNGWSSSVDVFAPWKDITILPLTFSC